MNTSILKNIALTFVILMVLLPDKSNAHEPDHTYMFLRVYEDGIEGRVEITANDINRELGLDINPEISEVELAPHIPTIKKFLEDRMSFANNGNEYRLNFTNTVVFPLDEEEDYIQFNFEVIGLSELTDEIQITYDTFFGKSPNHKGILIIEYNWEAGVINNHTLVSHVFTKDEVTASLSLKDQSVWNGFVAMVKLGIWHIWIGLDHILFLVALVLPAVVRRRSDGPDSSRSLSSIWKPVEQFRPAALYILKIVTFFTIAHSITLAIASLGILDLPSRIVESIIAFSIALAALHNITPIFRSKEWVVAFVFGLFHGFGFASVLGEKGLGGDYMILSLFGFNGGVEIGQVAIIGAIFPLLYMIRKFQFYPRVLTYGSALLILISLHWSIERFFGMNIPLGRWMNNLTGFLNLM